MRCMCTRRSERRLRLRSACLRSRGFRMATTRRWSAPWPRRCPGSYPSGHRRHRILEPCVMTLQTPLFADWVVLNASGSATARALADALVQACEGLSDEALRALPATPDDAAQAVAGQPFAAPLKGAHFPFHF